MENIPNSDLYLSTNGASFGMYRLQAMPTMLGARTVNVRRYANFLGSKWTLE
eukprot:gene18150-13029_t